MFTNFLSGNSNCWLGVTIKFKIFKMKLAHLSYEFYCSLNNNDVITTILANVRA